MRLKFALEAVNKVLQEKLKRALFCPGALGDPQDERVFDWTILPSVCCTCRVYGTDLSQPLPASWLSMAAT